MSAPSSAEADHYVSALLQKNPNLLVPWYLMLSWLYYERDISLVSDELFDRLCKRLLDEWDSVEHWHKGLLDKESLRAGTGYHLRDIYPSIVKGAALRAHRELP